MLLILLGAPGAGKGTQGSILAEKLGIPKIATVDILRQAVREGTALGLEARRFMDAGELVPDEVILGLVRDALAAAPGAILDGFPRNAAQAEALREILAASGKSVDAVIAVEPDWYLVVGSRAEPLLAMYPASPEQAVLIAFDVGNRHFRLAVEGDALLVPDDLAM